MSILKFKKREPTAPHLNGTAVCLACKHEWLAVIPVGACDPFDCPSCGCSKGVYKRFVAYTDVSTWQCGQCAGWLFSAILLKNTPTIACANCGNLINAIDLFNK